MNKKLIRLTESDLHRIIMETVNKVLINEGLFDRFRRSKGANAATKSMDLEGEYEYNPEDRTYYYIASNGQKYSTNITPKKSEVGKNWNPFGAHFAGGHQMTPQDVKKYNEKLKSFDKSWWKGGRPDIENNIKKTSEPKNKGWNKTPQGIRANRRGLI